MNDYIKGLSYPLTHPFRRDSERARELFRDVNLINGVIRWKSNNAVPPQELLDYWNYLGFKFNMKKSIEAREEDTAIALGRYRQMQLNRKLTTEEISEMRANFGEGTVVVDVITGKKYKL